MTNPRCIRVWLGGSFDPIHLGHLQMIAHVYQQLKQTFANLDIIAKLLPTAGSPLKDKPTSNQQRLDMLSLAIQDFPFLSIDHTELQYSPPVYSFNTFSDFRQRYPNDVLIFIVGQDSIAQLGQWYRGFELITLTNLWVLPRPALYHQSQIGTANLSSTSYPMPIDDRLMPFIINSPKDLINQSTNHIYMDKFVVPDIASRDIRAWIQSGEAEQLEQARLSLPSQVYHYIIEHRLYT